MEWNEKWGPQADYNIVPDKTNLDGVKIGDRVVVIEEDNEEGCFEGDEGTVVGISHTPGGMMRGSRDELIVAWDDQDPTGISPDAVDVL